MKENKIDNFSQINLKLPESLIKETEIKQVVEHIKIPDVGEYISMNEYKMALVKALSDALVSKKDIGERSNWSLVNTIISKLNEIEEIEKKEEQVSRQFDLIAARNELDKIFKSIPEKDKISNEYVDFKEIDKLSKKPNDIKLNDSGVNMDLPESQPEFYKGIIPISLINGREAIDNILGIAKKLFLAEHFTLEEAVNRALWIHKEAMASPENYDKFLQKRKQGGKRADIF